MVVSVVTLVGLLNGYGVVHLPAVPGKRALEIRVDRFTQGYTRRLSCSQQKLYAQPTRYIPASSVASSSANARPRRTSGSATRGTSR